MDVFLETERLVLRRFTGADLDMLVELDGDPDAVHHRRAADLARGAPRRGPAGVPALLPAVPRLWVWAAVEKATGQFLGWFHLRPPEDASPDEPELGYRLRRSAWARATPPRDRER